MSVRLVILGLLHRRNLYGYELKQIIEAQMGDWTSIAFGSIYFALRKLADEGLIEQVSVERSGNRPSRSVYSITKSGRVEFLRMLRELWMTPKRQYHQLDIALYFHHALPPEELLACVAQQIAITKQILAHIEQHRDETLADKSIPRMARAIFDHSTAHYEAELRWLEAVRGKLETGEWA
jgi:DNA-binding PadR family transcriptional regulator